MSFSCGLRDGDHLHAELGRALTERPQHAFAISLFVVVLALVGVLLTLGQHDVDQTGEFMGGGSNGFGLVHA